MIRVDAVLNELVRPILKGFLPLAIEGTGGRAGPSQNDGDGARRSNLRDARAPVPTSPRRSGASPRSAQNARPGVRQLLSVTPARRVIERRIEAFGHRCYWSPWASVGTPPPSGSRPLPEPLAPLTRASCRRSASPGRDRRRRRGPEQSSVGEPCPDVTIWHHSDADQCEHRLERRLVQLYAAVRPFSVVVREEGLGAVGRQLGSVAQDPTDQLVRQRPSFGRRAPSGRRSRR